MGTAYSARQSSYAQGDTIDSDDTNNEFDAILSAFGTSGHSHDGTAGEGGAISKLLNNTLTFGAGTSGTDIVITFDGESNDGVFSWMEDEDYFKFSDDILINSTEMIMFGDSGTYIYQSADGVLDLVSDTEIEINATTIDINGNIDASGTYSGGGLMTTGGNIVIPNAGNIGSASDTDAIAISSGGVVTMNQIPVFSAGINVSGGTIAGTLATAAQANVTSLGTLTTLTVDNIIINGTNIGHTSDTDAIAISSGGVVTFSQAPVFPDGSINIADIDLDGGTDIGAAIVDADLFLIDDGAGGTMRKTAASRLKTYIGSSTAADDLSVGDAAVTLATSAGNITVDAQGNDTDIIFKGTDGSSDTTFLTIDGSAAGEATFNAGIVIADAGNIGSASDKDAIAISSGGVVTMNQIPVFSAGINVSGGTIAGTLATAAQTNITSLGTLTALTVDDVAVNGKVITMTGSSSDTVVFTAGTNGTLSIVTTDAAAAAANIQITADGTVDIDSAGVLTLDSGAAINIEPASGSAILLDGTISIDAGVVTGATSITSTAFVGDITGDVTGNADTATLATSVTVSANNSTDETVYPVFVDGATGTQGAETDTGLSYNPSTGVLTTTSVTGNLTGNVTGNVSGTAATVTTAAQSAITSLGTLTTLTVDNIIINVTNFGHTTDSDAFAIGSGGVVTFSQAPVFPDGSINIADLDIDGGTEIGAAIVDADLFIVDDGAGGTNRKVLASRLKTYIGSTSAADDISVGDAAVTIATSAGNITIDAQGNDTDIIFKGTDGSSDTTFLTIDGSEAGEATFNAGIVIADAGNIGSASDKDAIAISSGGVVTMNQIPVFSAGINVSGGTIAGTLATAAQANVTSLGTLTTLTVDNIVINGTNIGHTSDTDAIAIASNGVVTFSQIPVMPANSIDSDEYIDGSIDRAHLSADIIDGTKLADDAIDSEHYADGSIDTAHIADNQITLAKMAGLARGKIIYGDSSGDPAALAVGSANYVLTSDGTDIAWAAAGGGGTDWEVIADGSTLASGQFINISDYEHIKGWFVNEASASSNTNTGPMLSTSGSSNSGVSTTSYWYSRVGLTPNSSPYATLANTVYGGATNALYYGSNNQSTDQYLAQIELMGLSKTNVGIILTLRSPESNATVYWNQWHGKTSSGSSTWYLYSSHAFANYIVMGVK